MVAVGVYRTEALNSLREAFARLLVAISLGIIFLSAHGLSSRPPAALA